MKTSIPFAAGALAFALSAGLVQAKLPEAPMDDAAKAAAVAKKAKAAEAKKKSDEALAKAEDRAVANYRQNHGMRAMPMAEKAKK